MTGRFDLAIFDNDGVLVDSEWHANGILAARGKPAFGFARMTPADRLRDAGGGVFTSMDELPRLLRRP